MNPIKVLTIITFCTFLYGEVLAQTQENGKPRGLPLDDSRQEKYNAGWTIHIDNDLLIPGSNRDQDYTGGLGITLTGRRAKENWWSIDPLLGMLDATSGFDGISRYHEGYLPSMLCSEISSQGDQRRGRLTQSYMGWPYFLRRFLTIT